MKIKEIKWWHVLALWFLVGCFMFGIIITYYFQEWFLFGGCCMIAGASMGLPVIAARFKLKEETKKWTEDFNDKLGKLKLDEFMENPVLYRQLQSS